LIKNKKTIIPFRQRVEIIKAVRYVDEVKPKKSWEQKINDIIENSVDVFVIGDGSYR